MNSDGKLTDGFGRRIEYLRISVTDRCNLRCQYCMPPEGIALLQRDEILSIEELGRIARCAVELGLNRIRISGGEPLVRLGIASLVRELAALPGLRDLAMTTNGILLREYALPLKDAGLRRLNVSVDTLDPERYREITRGGSLQDVWAGIHAALTARLSPVKINVVVTKTTVEEAPAFAALTGPTPLHVRFIELMPSGWMARSGCTAFEGVTRGDAAASTDAIRRALGHLEPADSPAGAGPAETFRLPGAAGTIGFITPMTAPFCGACNRLRLTAAGKLLPCLFSAGEVDVRGAIRQGAPDERVKELIMAAAASKPAGRPDEAPLPQPSMAKVGG